MGIFSSIFGKTIKIDDEFFGTMLFMEFKKKPEINYFECRRSFEPSNEIIEIGIDGDINGPTEDQKEFFNKIESNYENIVKSAIPLIENEFKNWKEDFVINNFQEEFKAVYLKIPRCEKNPIIWEIAFETEYDLNHTITITMNDFEAAEILIDG